MFPSIRRSTRPPEILDRCGELLAERYELRELLGRGGQSEVYRARDLKQGDDVAVKVLVPNTVPDSVERMYREAFAMSSLQGTAAVRVLHQIQTKDGSMALVMELLHGRDLDDELSELEGRDERLPKQELVRIMEPIVNTLSAAHEQGIIHRDVKPANIWIIHPAYGGGVRLLDFGFAKLVRAVPITGTDDLAGTPGYVAPEVWLNGARAADARADVYSLGALLFRAITGRLPFEGTLVEILRDATGAPRPSLHALRPDLPPEVDVWVEQALAIDREARFARVTGMWRALRSLLSA